MLAKLEIKPEPLFLTENVFKAKPPSQLYLTIDAANFGLSVLSSGSVPTLSSSLVH